MTTVLSLPSVIVFVAVDFPARVIKLAVEPRSLARRNDAVRLGLGLVSINLRFPSFDPCGFAWCERPVFQSIGDAVLLILLAAVNAGRSPTVVTDFAARVIKLAV